MTVMTYGTFDLLHEGHINLLRKCRALGDRLIVGVTTPEFNDARHDQLGIPRKEHPFETTETRIRHIEETGLADLVIPETGLNQKEEDILEYDVDVLALGDDMKGRFDHLEDKYGIKVVYIPRTPGISSTQLRNELRSNQC